MGVFGLGMAYRVTSKAASRAGTRAPQGRGDPVFTRTVTITGAALASVALIAAGTALFGDGRVLQAAANDAVSHRALRIALVDPVAPTVVRRDPRIPIETPEARATAPEAARIDTPAQAPQRERAPDARTAKAAAIPLPAPRPIRVASTSLPPERLVAPETTGSLGPTAHDLTVAAAKPAHPPAVPRPKPRRKLTPFEKLYGPVRLASYAPTGAVSDTGLLRAPYDRNTAVYVIADETVYLPDGTELEAHSGLGAKRDDPRFVNVRMRGATPPHVYDLTLRERLFHGVQAIRLNPVGGNDDIFGRTGLLAHTYMLGPRGDSNGCVSFKNYQAFLRAYKTGKISRLAVIARLD
jgi:hypothetical protein